MQSSSGRVRGRQESVRIENEAMAIFSLSLSLYLSLHVITIKGCNRNKSA